MEKRNKQDTFDVKKAYQNRSEAIHEYQELNHPSFFSENYQNPYQKAPNPIKNDPKKYNLFSLIKT